MFDSAKVAPPSSDPFIKRATSFDSLIFRTHPHEYIFLIDFYPYGMGPPSGKCASKLFNLFPGCYDNLLQYTFSKSFHIGVHDQLNPLNTWTQTIWLDRDLADNKPSISTKTEVSAIIINSFFPHSKHFSETEGFPIDDASFIEIRLAEPPMPKSETETFLLFPFP